MNYLEEYYNAFDEDGRLASAHGQVEYITTQKYIHECLDLSKGKRILEVGAGTGRYSIALAKEGYEVTAVELVEHNIEVLRSKLDGTEPITVLQGNALDLSAFCADSFDLTLLLGPMYHLYTFEDRQRALSEAVRVTKPNGYILVAYCMNEATILSYVFGKGKLNEVMENDLLTENWHCKSEPKELFELSRVEDIEALNGTAPVKRYKFVASDGATRYLRELIDTMDEPTFKKWVEYHLAVCERQELIGASHHTLDILKKLPE